MGSGARGWGSGSGGAWVRVDLRACGWYHSLQHSAAHNEYIGIPRPISLAGHVCARVVVLTMKLQTFFAYDPKDTDEIAVEILAIFLVASGCILAGR